MLWRCPRCSCLNDPALLTCSACGEPNRRHRRYRWEWAFLGVLLLLVAAGPALWQAVSERTRSTPAVSPLPDLGPQLPNLNGPEVPPLPDLSLTPTPLQPATAAHILITWMPPQGGYTLGQVRNDGAVPLRGLQLATGGALAGWNTPGSPAINLTERDLQPGETAGFALPATVWRLPSRAAIRDGSGQAVTYAERPYRLPGAAR